MASRRLTCRYQGCGFEGVMIAGRCPDTCPGCKREARWRVDDPDVRPEIEFNYMDRRLLKQLRISPE